MPIVARPPNQVLAKVITEDRQPTEPVSPRNRRVLTIKVSADTSSPPLPVLEAARDFSDRRAEVWPNVRAKHLEVHDSGDNFAEVTEGTWVVGLFWEHNHYDWS